MRKLALKKPEAEILRAMFKRLTAYELRSGEDCSEHLAAVALLLGVDVEKTAAPLREWWAQFPEVDRPKLGVERG